MLVSFSQGYSAGPCPGALTCCCDVADVAAQQPCSCDVPDSMATRRARWGHQRVDWAGACWGEPCAAFTALWGARLGGCCTVSWDAAAESGAMAPEASTAWMMCLLAHHPGGA